MADVPTTAATATPAVAGVPVDASSNGAGVGVGVGVVGVGVGATPDTKGKMKQGAGKRLNDKQRVEIIQLSENSKISKRQLADKYGVSEAAIRKLLLKKDDFLQRYYDTPEEIRDQRLRGKSVRLRHEHLGSMYVGGGAGTLSNQGGAGAMTAAMVGGLGGLGMSMGAAGVGAFPGPKSLYPQDDPWKQGLNVLGGKVTPFMKNFMQKPRDASLVGLGGATGTDGLAEEAAVAAAEGAGPDDLAGAAVDPEQPLPSHVDWLGFARMLRDIRRAFHRYPEIGYQEFRTQAFIRRFCESSLRIPGKNIRTMASTGLVIDVCYENATIAPNDKRKLPVVAFRADMDALPIEEMNDHLPYCSTQKKTRKDVRKRKKRKTMATPAKSDEAAPASNDTVPVGDVTMTPGAPIDVDAVEPRDEEMDLSVDVSAIAPQSSGEADENDDSGVVAPAAHMCGHDGHMVMVLGLLALVVRQSHLLPRDTFVRFIFQPAEEGPGGAERMIQEGVLEEVDEVYGLHNAPFPLYSIHVRPGPVMAHEVEFWIDINGIGGHGSAPQNCVDPILAGAMVVQALQSIVSRTLPPTESAVVSVTQFNGGSTNNVIPSKVHLAGTIRDFDLAVAEKIKQRMEQIVHSTCLAAGATAQVTFKDSYPPVVNHHEETRLVQQVAVDTGLFVSEDGLPLMAAEDFSYFLRERKGCFFLLGTKEEVDDDKTRALHSNEFDFNDKAIPLGIRVFLGVLQSRLQCQLINVEDLQDFQVAMERIVG